MEENKKKTAISYGLSDMVATNLRSHCRSVVTVIRVSVFQSSCCKRCCMLPSGNPDAPRYVQPDFVARRINRLVKFRQ